MDTLQILDKLHSYYSDSFSQLITITLAFLGFAGIILPIMLQIFQSRSFKIEKLSIQSQLSKESEGLLKELFEQEKKRFQSQIKEEIDILNKRLGEQIDITNGGIFHVQGKAGLEKKYYASAAEDFAISAKKFFKGGDERNGRRALNLLMKECLPKIYKKDYSDNLDTELAINQLLEVMDKINENSRYMDDISSLKEATSKSKSREPEPEKPA